MIKVLIALEDKILADIVKTAFRQFAEVTAYPTTPARLADFLQDPDYHAVVVLLRDAGQASTDEIAAIRAVNPSIEILALMDRGLKEKTNRMKVELGIFSSITLPLDPFDLVRRIARLAKHISEKHPIGG